MGAATTTRTHIVHRNTIPRHATNDALRTINQHLCEVGMNAYERARYAATACWFPELTGHPAIQQLQQHVPVEPAGEVWTQILLQFPQPPNTPTPELHRDKPPGEGRRFAWIAGIPLTPSGPGYGGIQFDTETPTRMMAGDVVVFPADTPHHGGVNHSPHIRHAVYFRYLEAA